MMREMDFVDEYYAEKDLSLLKKLTLVIPTYNRNYYLSRCLWYHAHFPFGEIIVADSSPEEKKIVNRETIAKVREMFGANVRYLEYEPETEKYGGDIYRKWGDAVQHVETEYTQICTDKEFLVPLTLTLCLQYLQDHPDYVVVSGKHYHLERNSYGTYFYRDNPTTDIHLESAWNRFEEMTKNPGCTLLSLHKTVEIKQVYRSLIENSISDIRFGEIYLELQDAIRGKVMKLADPVHLYRDTIAFGKMHGFRKKGESSSFRYPQIWEYTSSDYTKYYSCFRNGILRTLSEVDEFDPMGSEEQIDKMLHGFINRRMGSAHPLRNIAVVKNIFYYLPKIMQNLILTKVMKGSCSIGDYSPKVLENTLEVKLILHIITDSLLEQEYPK